MYDYEKVLLNSGYKEFEPSVWHTCDRFYQKKIDDKRYFNVYYYDKFKDSDALDYVYEFEYREERDNYWYKTFIWALNDYPYTIEEIEEILLGERK